VNENGWLEITGGGEKLLTGGQQTNLLWALLPENDFVISVHLKSEPLFDFQQARLFLHEKPDHYISLSCGYCAQSVLGGNGIFLDYRLSGEQAKYLVATDATDLQLLLIHAGGLISAPYSEKEGQWQHIASIETDFVFMRFGLSATNGNRWEEGYDVIGMFDYFEIRARFHQSPTFPPERSPQAVIPALIAHLPPYD
jgi:hypothetical protein